MLSLTNVTLSYPQNEVVLHQITLHVQAGECVVLTGPSGSGKSSLLKVINGLATRYDHGVCQGQIKIDGQDMRTLELYQIAQRIASVFQNPKTAFFNVNTTLELLFFLENTGVPREEMKRRLDGLLKVFPIRYLLNRDIFALSGGEKQILCLAATYIAGVKWVVLDEPSANLDTQAIAWMTQMLHLLKQKGVALIVAEHRLYYLMSLADRIVRIERGKLVQEYTAEALQQLTLSQLHALGLRSCYQVPLTVFPSSLSGKYAIQYVYRSFDKTHALHLVNQSLKKGHIYGAVGHNGCGKTSFLQALIGVDKQAKVMMKYEGKQLSRRQRMQRAAWVMQDVNHQLFTDEVVKEIQLGVKNIEETWLHRVIDQLDLKKLLSRHPLSLSGGEKQRVAIASVLLSKRPMLYFDEPTSGMDYEHMDKISNLLKQARSVDNVMIMVSHDREFLNRTVDHLLTITLTRDK